MSPILEDGLAALRRAARSLRRGLGHREPFSDLEMHLWMLADGTRAEAYAKSIDLVVREGDVVVDVGAGTGLLSMMACRAGAARVYAIEETSVAALARLIIEDNGMSDRIVLLEGRSTSLSLPEPADVVVSETIGSFVFSEGILGTLHDARSRFLRPGGALVPGRIRIHMTPVECWREGIGFWERPVDGFDYTAARDHVAHGVPAAARKIEKEDHLAPPGLLYELDFTVGDEVFAFERELEFRALRDGTLHGFLGTWEALLHEDVVLRCDPEAPPVHWPPLHFRLPAGLAVRNGERIILNFARRDPRRWSWRWNARIER
jgi:protein arginine N-methyltransferase 1